MRPKTARAASLFAASAAIVSLTVGGPAFATSACKGLEQPVCETTEACRWQAGYTRKDGIEVASHCRSTGKKKEVTPEASTEGAPEKAS
jgi:hypothetical protein